MATYYLLDGTEYKEVSLEDLLKAEKLVKESDLLTVKGSSETKVKTLESEITALKTRSDELLGRATIAESASEEVKQQLETLKPLSERVPTLESELNALKEKHSAAETQLLTTRRNSLIEKYSLKDDAKSKIESMTADELTSAENAANLFGISPQRQQQQSSFDRNNGNNRQNYDETSGLDDIKAGMKEIQVAYGPGSDDD